MAENKLTLSSCLMPLCKCRAPETSQDHFSMCVSVCLCGCAHVYAHMCITMYVCIYTCTNIKHFVRLRAPANYKAWKYRVLKLKRSSSHIPSFFSSLILLIIYFIYKVKTFVRKNHCISSFNCCSFKVLKGLNSRNKLW